VNAMLLILKELETNPELVSKAPHHTPVSRLDEGLAARELNIRYTENKSNDGMKS